MKNLTIVLATGALLLQSALSVARSPANGAAPVTQSGNDCHPEARVPPGFVSAYARTDGTKIHYVRGGKGKTPVIFLHGWPQDWSSWSATMLDLVDRYDVIAADLRGLGQSGIPESGYDSLSAATDIAGLMDALGISQAHIVGHDIGGHATVSFAYAFPDKMRSMTVIDVPTPGTDLFEAIEKHPKAWHWKFHSEVALASQLVAGHERDYLEDFIQRFAAGVPGITAKDVDYYACMYSHPERLRAGFEYYKAFADNHVRNRVLFANKLSVPALAVNSSETVPFPHVTQALSTFGSNVTGVTPRPSGHWIPDQHPHWLADQLGEFFSKVDSRRP